MDNYSIDELLALGFSRIGENVRVSRDVRLFAISGHLDDGVRIDTYSILTGHIELGRDVHIAPLCFLSATGGRITMEDGSGMGPQVTLLTKSDDYTSRDLSAGEKLDGDITVGRHSILGAGCRILPGVTIGSDASIGTGCVISKDVKPGDILVSRGASSLVMGNRLEDRGPA